MNETLLGIIVGALCAATAWILGSIASSRANDKYRNNTRVETELDNIIAENTNSREELEHSITTTDELKNGLSELGGEIGSIENAVESAREELRTDEQTANRVSELFNELTRRAEQDNL